VRHETLRFGQSWVRLAPWRGNADIAQLVVGPDARAEASDVAGCLDRTRELGYRAVVTGAVNDEDAAPFLDAGLTLREHLHLLACDLTTEPPAPERRLSWAGAWDRRGIVALDDAAFEPFWRLGAAGVRDALDATPKSRLRVGRGDPRVAAYAIAGRAGEYGYIQRVAVHPDARHRGWGRALVADAVSWMWKHGSRRAYVNTQLENHAALDLYQTCGFTVLPDGLSVLGGDL
jgi:ribosomal protein S18 acetylase RimI-like enzyme